MTFILRIFFMGLIAFVPSRDGKELTVLLIDARQSVLASDKSSIEAHHPMLLARAGRCTGQCEPGDPAIAQLLFPGANPTKATNSLSSALGNGAAWRLDGSDLSIVLTDPKPLTIQRNPRVSGAVPGNQEEGKDFRWVADLSRIHPSAGAARADVMTSPSSGGPIVARLRLKSGTVWTYRLVSVDDKVLPLGFKTLGGDRVKVDYSQALADWVVAEIQVSGDTVKVVENGFGGGQRRMIELAPKPKQNGVVEVAVMNIPQPPSERPAGKGETRHDHESGKHFEIYYNLAAPGLSKQERPVPHIITREGGVPSSLVNQKEPRSELLEALGLGSSRGFYDRIICPVAQLSDGGKP